MHMVGIWNKCMWQNDNWLCRHWKIYDITFEIVAEVEINSLFSIYSICIIYMFYSYIHQLFTWFSILVNFSYHCIFPFSLPGYQEFRHPFECHFCRPTIFQYEWSARCITNWYSVRDRVFKGNFICSICFMYKVNVYKTFLYLVLAYLYMCAIGLCTFYALARTNRATLYAFWQNRSCRPPCFFMEAV